MGCRGPRRPRRLCRCAARPPWGPCSCRAATCAAAPPARHTCTSAPSAATPSGAGTACTRTDPEAGVHRVSAGPELRPRASLNDSAPVGGGGGDGVEGRCDPPRALRVGGLSTGIFVSHSRDGRGTSGLVGHRRAELLSALLCRPPRVPTSNGSAFLRGVPRPPPPPLDPLLSVWGKFSCGVLADENFCPARSTQVPLGHHFSLVPTRTQDR